MRQCLREFELPRGTALPPEPTPVRPFEAIIFSHGFLGSKYDMAHVCEELAAKGFMVFAPEFALNIGGSWAVPSGGALPKFDEARSLRLRTAIVAATRELLPAETRWGILGHSVGAMHLQVMNVRVAHVDG